jgi:hypothetical protein
VLLAVHPAGEQQAEERERRRQRIHRERARVAPPVQGR